MEAKIMDIISQVDGTCGICIEDFTGAKRFSYNEDIVFPSASLIKVPILVELFLRNFRKEFSLDDHILVSNDDIVGGAGLIQHLSIREYTLLDLATLMIIQSDNTATNVLVDFLGIDRINETIQNLGLTNTYSSGKLMVVPHPYPRKSETSPRDMAALFRLLGEGKIHSWLLCERILEILKKQKFNDIIPKYLMGEEEGAVGKPKSVAIAHKTGGISGVRHDAGIVYTPVRDFIIVGLTKDLRDVNAGMEAISRIARIVYDEMVQK